MKVKLLRTARIRHEAGEIVEVSPAEAGFLFSTGSAVEVIEKRETPEDAAVIEKQEAAKTRTTRKKK